MNEGIGFIIAQVEEINVYYIIKYYESKCLYTTRRNKSLNLYVNLSNRSPVQCLVTFLYNYYITKLERVKKQNNNNKNLSD